MRLENDKTCKIVQDLMPSYIENLLSDDSKSFIDNHISSCNNCKEYLDTMSQNILNEKKNKLETNKLEIDSLKKYKLKMSILKRILVVILIIILIIVSILFSRYIYHKNVINQTLGKIKDLNNSDNFYIGRKSIDIDYTNGTITESIRNIYYKDGKYKREGDWFVMYGQIDSTDYLEIFHETKTIENIKTNYIPYTKEDLTLLYSNINKVLFTKDMLNTILIMENDYNGKKCYVIRTNSDNNGYSEFWIDKETNIMFREVSEHYGLYYRENIYTLALNQTLDEDVEINNLEQYSDYERKNITINDTSDEITQEILENVRKNYNQIINS